MTGLELKISTYHMSELIIVLSFSKQTKTILLPCAVFHVDGYSDKDKARSIISCIHEESKNCRTAVALVLEDK